MSHLGEKADTAPWFKSSYSSNSAGCVEVALTSSQTRVRDSKNPSAGFLAFGYDQWCSFLASLGSDGPWFKSSYSTGSQGCVEVSLEPGRTGVRDSKQPENGALYFDREQWRSFIGSLHQH